ncbi:phospholipase A1 PLIP1, chloroplastic-like [Oryza brachyantha]|uniref:phospholipase A1 PLIP1, chloroplastic-like n=1 Tax=Oryza brachyantha TaxID=4533 RepID=UPI001ADA6FA1|nr:phospholipase A1 PLIP1, chloroplastic-like [Oryza brachyantha]
MVASVAAAHAAAAAAGGGGRRARREPASMHAGIRRSRSEPHLRCSRRGGAAGAALTTSRSIGVFPFQFGAAPLRPPPLPDGGGDGSRLLTVTGDDPDDAEPEMPEVRRPEAHWLDRLLELRSRFHDPAKRHSSDNDLFNNADEDDDVYRLDGDEYHHHDGCGVNYEDDDEHVDGRWDRESFSKLLARAPLGEARLFAQLAFLCNMAYVIPEIKVEELKKYYGLRFVTSSLEKKAEAGEISSKLDVDSTRPRAAPAFEAAATSGPQPRRPIRSHLAYEVAASAASYVHARARGLLSFGGGQQPRAEREARTQSAHGRLYNSGVAAYVAASTVTAVVAAEEEARQEAARDLRSPLSSPCEWFVCDEADARTRCFVIQGSDSLASWQANLLFEPTVFEGTGVLVHRGIYEAAKGIYEQLMPEIAAHLAAHGERARLRLTGHSLGGSLALLVSLMLVARGVVGPEALLPVVTFGAPSVFCGGQRVLDALGVGEGHVRSVAMHRDIVPRAFSCRYPGHAVALLKRLNGVLRNHPCLNNQRMLYTPMGTTYILQPDGAASPPHPFLPEGAALFRLDPDGRADRPARHVVESALRAFLNSPHPLETLSDLSAYGSEGAILRDHESSNYFRALNALTRVPRRRKQPEIVWQLPGVERLQQYWWPGIAGTVFPAPPVTVRNKELITEA